MFTLSQRFTTATKFRYMLGYSEGPVVAGTDDLESSAIHLEVEFDND